MELTPGAEEDDGGSEEGSPVVHARVAGGEGEGDADESEERSNGVAEVVPCVDADGSAVDVGGDGEYIAGEQELDGDDGEEHPEGVVVGQGVGRADEGDAFGGDGEGGAGHGEADDGGGKGFSLSVSVGMGFVRGAQGDAESDVDDGGAEDVGEGFDAVGDEGEGVADEAGKALGEGEEEVRDDAEEGRAESAMDVQFGFGSVGHERGERFSILRWGAGLGAGSRE